MPYPGWAAKQIDQYRAVKSSVAKKHPDMTEDQVQAFAAKVVNSQRGSSPKKRGMAPGMGE